MSINIEIGWIASGLVFATFCAKGMLTLRALAIASNIAFISYGYLDALWPIVVLHVGMLPLNTFRLLQELSREKAGTVATSGCVSNSPLFQSPELPERSV